MRTSDSACCFSFYVSVVEDVGKYPLLTVPRDSGWFLQIMFPCSHTKSNSCIWLVVMVLCHWKGLQRYLKIDVVIRIKLFFVSDYVGKLSANEKGCYICNHDVMTWTGLPHYWHIVTAMNRSLVDSPHKGPVMRNFDIFSDVNLNKPLHKLSICRCFETLWRSYKISGMVIETQLVHVV